MWDDRRGPTRFEDWHIPEDQTSCRSTGRVRLTLNRVAGGSTDVSEQRAKVVQAADDPNRRSRRAWSECRLDVTADRLDGGRLGDRGVEEARPPRQVVVTDMRSMAKDYAGGDVALCAEPADSLGIEGSENGPMKDDDAGSRVVGDPGFGKLALGVSEAERRWQSSGDRGDPGVAEVADEPGRSLLALHRALPPENPA
jgi:hypothetical protein